MFFNKNFYANRFENYFEWYFTEHDVYYKIPIEPYSYIRNESTQFLIQYDFFLINFAKLDIKF